MKLLFLSELDSDILQNINKNTKAVLIDEYGFWIEILISGKYFVPDGWEGLETPNFWEAFQYYQHVKLTN